MKKAGWIWTAANGFLIAKGGLSSDPILATSGVTTTLASGSNAVFGDSANRFSGPAFLASTTAYAGENFRNAVTNNPNPLSDSAEAAFGVGVTAGVAVLFYGQEIKKFLEKSSPVERLMKKLPQVDQGTLAKGLLYLAYTVEVARGISSVITGVRTGDAREFSQGVSNLALIGTYCVGNNYAAKAANLRNEAKNLREEIGAQPQGSAQPALNVG